MRKSLLTSCVCVWRGVVGRGQGTGQLPPAGPTPALLLQIPVRDPGQYWEGECYLFLYCVYFVWSADPLFH